jgi:zinc transport system substrate-binding protein
MKYFLLLCAFVGMQLSLLTAHVVVTSKPLYFVVAPLLKDIDTPKLIINHGHCGHHYHIRPSEIQLIKTAKLILWNGKIHEPFMSKLLQNGYSNITVFDETDGFSWLSATSVIEKLPKVVVALKEIYPANLHKKIDANAAVFLKRLEQLYEKIIRQTECIRGRSILTTYPFFTYFAKEYGLNIATYMVGSPEEAVTPHRLRNIYKTLENNQVFGVVKDHHIPSHVIQALVQRYKLPILTIDTEAVDVPINIDGYYILIERIAQSIVKWAQ